MTPEKQRIAIAEACGWYHRVMKSPIDPAVVIDAWEPPGKMKLVPSFPDYLNDLNAMHETEKILPRTKVSRYLTELWGAMCKDGNQQELELGTFHATASQRAEAFLRTIGKWEDE